MLIACLKKGDKYPADYVNKLYRACRRHSSADFVCFTDDAKGVDCATRPAPDLPEWWGKVWLFSLREPMLFLDLDCVITGNLDDLFVDRFTICFDPWQPPDGVRWNSSVMYMTGEEYAVWEKFSPDVIRHSRGGDQDWIRDALGKCSFWPDDWCLSYKVQALNGPRPDTRVVYFHGHPKPHEVTDDWVQKNW